MVIWKHGSEVGVCWRVIGASRLPNLAPGGLSSSRSASWCSTDWAQRRRGRDQALGSLCSSCSSCDWKLQGKQLEGIQPIAKKDFDIISKRPLSHEAVSPPIISTASLEKSKPTSTTDSIGSCNVIALAAHRVQPDGSDARRGCPEGDLSQV